MDPEETLRLAPPDLAISRRDRWSGDGFAVTLSRFAPADVELIRRTYKVVKQAHALWLHIRDAAHLTDSGQEALLQRHILPELRDRRFLLTLRDLGAATYALGTPPKEVRAVLHDIRGGALLALIGYAAAEARGEVISAAERATVILRARDHARLMRNAVSDLDPVLRDIDAGVKTHTMLDFVAKWDQSIYRAGERAVSVTTDVAYDGFVCRYDLETAALDRVIYNHVNNAARFSADDRVTITAVPIGERLIRWVIENTLYPEHNLSLRESVGADLGRLYHGGITRGGHGIGLANCAELVQAALGAESVDALIMSGALGAMTRDHRYIAWFHWPIYDPRSDVAAA